MPRPKISWLKTGGVALIGAGLFWAFLAKAIPLALICWQQYHGIARHP